MNHYDVKPAEVPVERVRNGKPLRGRCTSCFNPDGVLFHFPLSDGITTHLCRECAQRQALWSMADDQLQALLLPRLEAWDEIWGSVPGLSTGVDALENLVARLKTAESDERDRRKK